MTQMRQCKIMRSQGGMKFIEGGGEEGKCPPPSLSEAQMWCVYMRAYMYVYVCECVCVCDVTFCPTLQDTLFTHSY